MSQAVKPLNEHVAGFVLLNQRIPVVAGEAFKEGGGIYTLANGTMFKFTLEEVRSMPMPKWPWDFTEQPEPVDARAAPEHG